MKHPAATLLGFALFTGVALADPFTLSLTGTTETNLWGVGSLTGAANPGYGSFPGTGAWPGPIQSPTGGDAYLYKIDNGLGGGGPYPAGEGIYFGGASTVVNMDGGSLGIVDSTPVSGVKTVAFQIQIGQAFGYDLLDNNPALVTLNYTTASGTFTLASQSYAGVLSRTYNGSVLMPTGPNESLEPQDIYVNLWGMQWDLSSVTEDVLSYEIQFTGVQHASLGALQLDQTNTAYGLTSVFPGELLWNGGSGNANWSDSANWQGGSVPTSTRSARLTGAGAVADANGAVGTLTIAGDDGFELSSSAGGVLSTNIGINTSSTTKADYLISAPVNMTGYNLLEIDPDTTLTISGPITGAGFYKQGEGDLHLTGNNVFDENNAAFNTNGIILRGGTNTISGTNTYGGTANVGFFVRQDTTVILKGGDNRLDAKFIANLPTSTSRLELGADGVGSDQTFGGLLGVVGSQIVNGGGADPSVLTVNYTSAGPLASEFYGRIGGDGAGENNLSLVKTGTSVLALGNANTYNGGTSIIGGLVQVTGNGAFGSGPVLADGGGIQYGSAFDGLRAFTVGAGGATLDTQAFSVTYRQDITGSGRFTKAGAKGILTLTGNNQYAGGTTVTGGFLGVDSDTRLGAVPATSSANNLNLSGGGLWAADSFTLAANRGLGLGGPSSVNGIVGVAAGKTLTYAGVAANGGAGNGSLSKIGAGKLVFSGDNTYTGATDLYQGVLKLDFANSALTANIVNDAATNTLRFFGGDLEILGRASGAVSQTFGAATFGAGHSNISLDSNGGAGTSLVLNAITRSGGTTSSPTVNFDLPAAGSITTTTTTTINGVLASALTNGAAYATVNGNDWASLSGASIVALTGYETSTNEADWAATENIALSANATGVTTRTVNTLKLSGGADVALGSGQTLTLTTGGILVTGTGASSISGGTIRGSNGSAAGHRELMVFQNNTANPFTIDSVIANNAGNTATYLTKAGAGELILTGTNTFSGGLRINEGTLTFSSAANLGTSAATTASFLIIDGGTLRYTGAAATIGRNLTVGYNGAAFDASGSGALVFGSGATTTLTGTFARDFTLTGTNTGDNVFTNAIPDASAGVTTVVKSGAGTWVLSPGTSAGTNNAFTGGVVLNEGTLKVGKAGALNNTGVNKVTFAATAPAGTKLALNGFSIPIAGVAGAGPNGVVENGGAIDSTLTINSGQDNAFAGVLQNGAGAGKLGLTKSGGGIQVLSGANTYTGVTSVIGGGLVVNGSLGNTPVFVSGTGVLGGSGSIGGTVAILAGGSISPGNSPGTLVTGSETWGAGGRYVWEINDVNAGAGAGWDLLTINGSLEVAASLANKFTISLASLLASNSAGAVGNFSATQNYSWIIATTSGGVTNFSPDAFLIDTVNFANPYDGTFRVTQVDNNILLTYTAVPEPGTWGVLMSLALIVFAVIRRRRMQQPVR